MLRHMSVTDAEANASARVAQQQARPLLRSSHGHTKQANMAAETELTNSLGIQQSNGSWRGPMVNMYHAIRLETSNSTVSATSAHTPTSQTFLVDCDLVKQDSLLCEQSCWSAAVDCYSTVIAATCGTGRHRGDGSPSPAARALAGT